MCVCARQCGDFTTRSVGWEIFELFKDNWIFWMCTEFSFVLSRTNYVVFVSPTSGKAGKAKVKEIENLFHKYANGGIIE